jgi:hypothetical protein
VNDDGAITAIDAALALQYNAGLLGALPNPNDADVDQNDLIDPLDALLILQYVAGQLPTLPP